MICAIFPASGIFVQFTCRGGKTHRKYDTLDFKRVYNHIYDFPQLKNNVVIEKNKLLIQDNHHVLGTLMVFINGCASLARHGRPLALVICFVTAVTHLGTMWLHLFWGHNHIRQHKEWMITLSESRAGKKFPGNEKSQNLLCCSPPSHIKWQKS